MDWLLTHLTQIPSVENIEKLGLKDMKEKRQVEILEIENFLSIKKAKIKVKPITVLIGDNATGKSIVSKLLFLLRESLLWGSLINVYYKIFVKNTNVDEFIDEWKESFLSDFKETFPFKYLSEDFKITYKVGKWQIVGITKTGNSLEITFEECFLNLLKETASELKKFLDFLADKEEAKKLSFMMPLRALEIINSEVFQKKKKVSRFKNIFVPHARTMYLYLSALELEKRTELLDFPMKSFITLLEIIPKLIRKEEGEISTEFKKWERKTIQGELIFKEDRIGFKIGNKEYDLFHISSGHQELIPLIMILRYTLLNPSDIFRIFIEEPETHLFPTTQKALTYLFGFMYNLNAEFFITTHSPYVLTSFNTLILAKNLYKETKKEVIKKKYEPLWIDANDFIAYQVKDGEIKPIMDENHLIKAEVIDEVSENISEEVDKLLDLAYGDNYEQ